MTDDDRARRQYLEECGTACMACRKPGPFLRIFDADNLSAPADSRPTLRVRCACPACGADWWETWALAGVEAPVPLRPLDEVFEDLRRIAGGAWDGIDVEEFMKEMRGD